MPKTADHARAVTVDDMSPSLSKSLVSTIVGFSDGWNFVTPNTPVQTGAASVPTLTSKYHFLTVVAAPSWTFVVATMMFSF
jgi:hypothetical protein